MEEAQKDREKYYLDCFKSTYSDFPAGTIRAHEKPDFLVQAPDAVVGIEVTEFYRSDFEARIPRQAAEALREQCVRQAESICRNDARSQLYVSVYFSHWINLRKSIIRPLSARLAELVQSASLDVYGDIVLENDGQTDGFPEEIDSIHIRRLPSVITGFWNAPDVGWIPDCSTEQIQDVIDKKNRRAIDYRQECNSLWLVIVIDGFRISSSFNLPKKILNHYYRSEFDRSFLLDNVTPTSFRLSTYRATEASRP
jgi:hypothetical protein